MPRSTSFRRYTVAAFVTVGACGAPHAPSPTPRESSVPADASGATPVPDATVARLQPLTEPRVLGSPSDSRLRPGRFAAFDIVDLSTCHYSAGQPAIVVGGRGAAHLDYDAQVRYVNDTLVPLLERGGVTSISGWSVTVACRQHTGPAVYLGDWREVDRAAAIAGDALARDGLDNDIAINVGVFTAR